MAERSSSTMRSSTPSSSRGTTGPPTPAPRMTAQEFREYMEQAGREVITGSDPQPYSHGIEEERFVAARDQRESRQRRNSIESKHYPNRYPARPVYNHPSYALELEKVRAEGDLPLDDYGYRPEVRCPRASHIAPTYHHKREAWQKTGWVHVDQVLGQGAFARVYLGLRYDERHSDKELSDLHLAAIKEVVIKDKKVHGNASMEQIAIEAYCLKAFGHINIIRLLDCYSIPTLETFYFVLEYADAGNLLTEITRAYKPRTHLWGSYARNLFKGIVDGVHYMHHRGVAHQDLKPENVLLKISADGTNKVPKLADFGLSMICEGRRAGGKGARERLLQTKCRGTLSYKSPEALFIYYKLTKDSFFDLDVNPIAISEEDQDMGFTEDDRNNRPRRQLIFYPEYEEGKFDAQSSDIFSLGVILCEMLTGKYPYYHAKVPGYKKVIGLHPAFVCEPFRYRSKLSGQAFSFICQMLEPDTQMRLSIDGVKSSHWMRGEISGPTAPLPAFPNRSKATYTSPIVVSVSGGSEPEGSSSSTSGTSASTSARTRTSPDRAAALGYTIQSPRSSSGHSGTSSTHSRTSATDVTERHASGSPTPEGSSFAFVSSPPRRPVSRSSSPVDSPGDMPSSPFNIPPTSPRGETRGHSSSSTSSSSSSQRTPVKKTKK